ncbi:MULTISPECIES: response regulator transcription factor [unclassified Myroides]|uniref:LytR/AlgR family response regulator transcription factor n=1 Tax=unclassified Myroides TaxID=2642485 RepID=UPI0015FCA556|nr:MULTISPECIES: response regulator transcription factor [unclassified Myroides]MBB1149343.1 response regulator transcription factor [Myroides sp. NP-2]MDM1406752.1 response regulator transcription factor [Myroides sp. DF42-4-2]
MEHQQYKCMIIDDEPASHYVLQSYIEKNANLQLVKQCYNALEAMDYIRLHPVDLIFLDIDMPQMSGIEFLESIPQAPKTILTTAHSQYALKSYDYGVLDYLLKPISFPRFIKAIERFLSLYLPQEVELPPLGIQLKVGKETIEIQQDTINYIQSYGNYVKVFTCEKVHIVTTTTQEIVSLLAAQHFLRIHKSYVVNLTKITAYTEQDVSIQGVQIPIGITYKRELYNRLDKVE